MNSLYHFRDHYLETNGVQRAREKAKDVEKNLKETLRILDKLQCE